MAEQSGFFDAHFIDGEYDRVYLAEHFAKYFASFIGNGIFGGKSNELLVRENESPSMGVRVLSGQAWINGYWYENNSEHSLTIDVADGVLHRIDSIVVRWNHSERIIRLAVKKGTASTSPVAPTVQRDDDYYELKLADILVNAGTIKITQVNIVDKRLNTNECGLVVGVVQQLDGSEFGIQLEAYISEFITEHNDLSDEIIAALNAKIDTAVQQANNAVSGALGNINNVIDDGRNSINTVVNSGNAAIAGVVSTGQANIQKVVDDGVIEIDKFLNTKEGEVDALLDKADENQQRFDGLMEDLKEAVNDVDVAAIIVDVDALKTDVSSLKTDNSNTKQSVKQLTDDMGPVKQDIVTLKMQVKEFNDNGTGGMGIEDETEVGCYYVEAADGTKEWINPPNKPGIEYRLTERWNGSPVYQKIFYVASLPNKTVMGIEVDAGWNKVISIGGFAQSDDDMYFYPFPIIINGLTPAAVITNVEDNGENLGVIVIQTNEDLTYLKGHVTIKYTK